MHCALISLVNESALRALVAIALFTHTAQNMLNVSIALSRALDLPEWIVGAAVSLAAAAVTALSQFWGVARSRGVAGASFCWR